jgi:hypothetical protein
MAHRNATPVEQPTNNAVAPLRDLFPKTNIQHSNDKHKPTFAHSRSIVNDKSSDIFFVGHGCFIESGVVV